MARIQETPEVLSAIRRKAYFNSRIRETYGSRAEFTAGKAIMSFESQCQLIKSTRLEFLDTDAPEGNPASH